MATAEHYRLQAETLRKLAKASADQDAALAYNLRAAHFDYLAEQADADPVPRHGTDPSRATPPAQDQPAQQQQQVQPKDQK